MSSTVTGSIRIVGSDGVGTIEPLDRDAAIALVKHEAERRTQRRRANHSDRAEQD